MTTHYETLGVGERASQQQIKEAFRVLARKWHPDKHEGKADRARAEERFKIITEAYWVLSDPHRKLMYDEKLERERESKRSHGRVPVQHRAAQPRTEWRPEATRAAERAAEAERLAHAAARAKRRDEGFDAYVERMKRECEQMRQEAQGLTDFLRAQRKKAGTLF